MREYEYIGVLLTMAAYAILVQGDLHTAFLVGIMANVVLAIFFLSSKLFAMLGLQFYFTCANIYGLYNLGVFL